MRKIISILFLLVCFNTAFGNGFAIHFCNGNISNATMNGSGHSQCGCNNQCPLAGCCKKEIHNCKTDSHLIQSDVTIPIQKQQTNVNVTASNIISEFAFVCYERTANIEYNNCAANYSPPSDLYLLYSVLRI